jgi:S1-C subfamily serine protease
MSGSGTGFAVDATGSFLTNHHVIEGCTRLTVMVDGGRVLEARVIAADARSDLALIATDSPRTSFVSFRRLPLSPGESVVALGYPLRGLLATEANVSAGIVSALAGIRNDVTKVQISAPIQPGNSGGPLFDSRGAVVGVVVSTLNALKYAKATGTVPQNVNFAVKGEVAQLFLRSAGIMPTFGNDRSSPLSTAEIASRGRGATALVECNPIEPPRIAQVEPRAAPKAATATGPTVVPSVPSTTAPPQMTLQVVGADFWCGIHSSRPGVANCTYPLLHQCTAAAYRGEEGNCRPRHEIE